jgi:uncharacterized protein
LQFLDTGLINHALGIQAQMLAMQDLSAAHNGAIVPHMVVQELMSRQEITNQKPVFWVREKRQSNAEVDLVYTYQGIVIPIEVKSGATGSLKSLHQFIDACNHPYAVRIYNGPFKIEKTKTPGGKPYLLMNVPYYLATQLAEYLAWFVTNNQL